MNTIPPKIVIATRNQGKIKEIQDLLEGLSPVLLSLDDLSDIPEVIEDGDTFSENALKKARMIAAASGRPALADDSGLCVDALDGKPGVYSARYGGDGISDEEKCRRILHEMSDIPDDRRTARFICVIAFVVPNGEEKTFTGTCEGVITREIRGTGGFGYDPIFYYEEFKRTFAELDRETKNLVSHRGKALAELSRYLRSLA